MCSVIGVFEKHVAWQAEFLKQVLRLVGNPE